MTNILDAINAAAASMQQAAKQKTQSNEQTNNREKAAANGKKSTAGSSKPKTDTPKREGNASYVIPAEFKQAIENYLKGRADMKDKLTAKGKSIDGCCEYIFGMKLKVAKKNRGGKSAVGMYCTPEEIFGMAVHYYDESDEDLKKELKE